MENYYEKKYWKIANGNDISSYITHKQLCEFNWLVSISQNYCLDYACDFTLRQRRTIYKNGKVQHHNIDDSIAHQNVSEFLHRLNKKCFSTAYKRYGKKLDVVVSMEGGKDLIRASSETGKNLHIHFSIEKPKHMEPFEFVVLMRKTWLNTAWGNKYNTIKPITYEVGRLKYKIKNTLDAWIPTLSNCNKVLRSS